MRDLIDLTEQELNDVLMKPFVTFPYFHFVSINLSLISLGIFLQTSHLLGLVAYLPAIAFQSTWTLVQRSAEPKSLLRPAYRLLYRLRPVRVVRISLFLYVLAWLICLDICTDPTATVIPGFSLFENFFNLQACTFLMPFIIPLFICHSNVMKLLIASLGYLALLILPGDYLAAGLFRQNLLLVLVGYVSGLLIAATLMVVCGLYYQNIKQKMEIEKTLMLLHVIMMNTSSAMVLINEKMQTVGKPSASFDRIFGKQLDLFQILKTQSDLGQDDLHKLKEAIMMTVGEDRLAFELNKSNYPARFSIGLGEGTRVFDVLWDVATDQRDVVVYVVVTIVDVTESLENEQREHEMTDKMRKLIRLANAGQDRFHVFYQSLEKAFQEIVSELEGLGSDAWPKGRWVGLVHTLKGAARSLEMKELASLLHELEQIILDNSGSVSSALLLGKLEAIVSLMNSDLELARKHFRWDTSKEFYKISKKGVLSLAKEPSDEHLMEVFREVFPDFSTFLAERLAEANALALRLGKDKPFIDIQTANLLLLPEAAAALDAALPHIVGNAMDHGIELPDQRRSLGKPPAGTITARAEWKEDKVYLAIWDDGGGLNLDVLRRKAADAHGQEAADAMGPHELANFIFSAGVSTKDQVTDISGRGVGMGAARDAIRAAGGTMEIILLSDPAAGRKTGNLRVQIVFPARHFLKQGPLWPKDSLSGAYGARPIAS